MNSDNEGWNPLAISPEGLRTNGKYLMRFKKGAFASLLPVIPAIVRNEYPSLNTTTEPIGLEIGPLLSTQFFSTKQTIDYYEPFIPNDYLFTQYAKRIPGGEKMEKWEIYAYAVRDFFAKEGPFTKSEKTGEDFTNYREFMTGLKDEITYEN